MEELIQNYKEARKSFINAIDKFPTEKRDEALFDNWNLTELIAHLNGWDKFFLNSVQGLKLNKIGEFPASPDNFNEETLRELKGISWDEVYKEFANTGELLFKELGNLSFDDFTKPLWSNNEMTTKDFLTILTSHINDEHLPLVIKVI